MSAGDVDRNGDVVNVVAPRLTPREVADLAFYVDRGLLVIQTPEETESWHRRRELERILDRRASRGVTS